MRLPNNGNSADDVRGALTRTVAKLPEELRRTLTWDEGKEAPHQSIFEARKKVQKTLTRFSLVY